MFRPLVIFAIVASCVHVLARPALAAPPIECVAAGSTAGKAADRSNLHGKLEDGTPANRLGAWGSAIAYTGRNDLYVVLPDRGPNGSAYNPSIDNTTSYPARVQTFRITVDPRAHTVNVKPIDTLLLTNEEGAALRGLSSDFVAGRPSNFAGNGRIDPEGLRISSDRRHYYLSDEYGPGVFQFDAASGRRTRIFPLPQNFAVARPAATGAAEQAGNASGRQANHGLEGLAITPNGRTLAVILQAPLLQDTVVDKEGRRIGVNVRLLTIEIDSGQTQQYVYQLSDARQTGVNEILAVNNHEFLVLERDAKAATKATAKSVFLVDLEGATDVSHVDALPPRSVPKTIRPVKKRLFLDLLDRQYGLAGATLPAKIEGLTFGPDLPDGRHLLLVTSDNDFHVSEPSRLFAFAIAPAALPDYEPQQFTEAAPEKQP